MRYTQAMTEKKAVYKVNGAAKLYPNRAMTLDGESSSTYLPNQKTSKKPLPISTAQSLKRDPFRK